MMRRLVATGAIVLMAVATGVAQRAVVTGRVTSGTRVTLPATAVLEVTLVDVSRPDGQPVVVGRAQVPAVGRLPIPFDLPYSLTRISPRHRYSVSAQIVDRGRTLFTSSGVALVITQGHDTSPTVALQAVARPLPPSPPPAAAPSAGPAPRTPLAPLPPAVALRNLPASFTGTLPCADCPGIRYELDLFPDDSFFVKRTYLERPAAPTQFDMGSWVLSSDRRVVVLQGTHGPAEMFAIRSASTLRMLDRQGQAIDSTLPYTLRRSSRFTTIAVQMPMRGVYRAATGSMPARFTECSTGQSWPVEAQGAAQQLDAMYHGAIKGTDAWLLMALDGRLESRRSGRPALIVEGATRALSGSICGPRFSEAPLENTPWTLTELGATAVASGAASGPGAQAPTLRFRSDARSFSASSGCVRLTGRYQDVGDALAMAEIGTMKACATVTGTETAFQQALGRTRRYRILGNTLELYDVSNRRLARFEARQTD